MNEIEYFNTCEYGPPPSMMFQKSQSPRDKGVHTMAPFCSEFPHKYTTLISIIKYVITKKLTLTHDSPLLLISTP